MTVNGYVEWFDEAHVNQWELIAEFKYYDDAISFAKTQSGTVRAMHRITDTTNAMLWHSDMRRAEIIETR